MPLKFDNDIDLLNYVSDAGIGSVHIQGYSWFWNEFMPALKRAEGNPHISNEIISDGYYVAGDVHDFNEAPKAAINSYKKSLEFDPLHGEAHREIANMLGHMGRYEEALIHSDRAIEINPDDECAISDRDIHTSDVRDLYDNKGFIDEKTSNTHIYVQGDMFWQANEYLANADPQKALKLLDGINDEIVTLRAKTLCYGALGETQKYLNTWSEIADKSTQIDMTYADWFFIETPVYENEDIWHIWLASKAKYTGIFARFDSLSANKNYQSLSLDEGNRLSMMYCAYESSDNKKELNKLYKRFPDWVEVKEALES